MPDFRPVIVIPVYDHDLCIAEITERLARNWPVILVDDGSHAKCAAVLDTVAAKTYSRPVTLLRQANGGKGAAVMAGMRRALTDGYTHVLQVDADGQHDLTAVAGFLDAAQKAPEALICGYPVYDASAPLARKKGREVSNLWVKINGLSGAVRDSLCGFRVYPLSAMVKLFDARMGLRMDFDAEVLVRLLWLDTPVVNRPVGVTYPADGISHFHAFADNVRISCAHTRLFFGMLVRLPGLLRRKNV